jgi:hypothetical protein
MFFPIIWILESIGSVSETDKWWEPLCMTSKIRFTPNSTQQKVNTESCLFLWGTQGWHLTCCQETEELFPCNWFGRHKVCMESKLYGWRFIFFVDFKIFSCQWCRFDFSLAVKYSLLEGVSNFQVNLFCFRSIKIISEVIWNGNSLVPLNLSHLWKIYYQFSFINRHSFNMV